MDIARSIGDLCNVLPPTEFAELDAMLTKLGARLGAREVHALYLGAITSTSFRVGPQHLLGHVFGEDPVLGETPADAKRNLPVLLGYWNTLLHEREGGRAGFAPASLAAKATREELIEHARRRDEELTWFIRGIDAGGGDPMEFGAEGQRLLEGLAQGSGQLRSYADLLERMRSATAGELRKSRTMLLDVIATIERIMGDLMDVSDAVRRAAMHAFSAAAGSTTDDGVHIAKPTKVGRNGACPCGSGKKWKKCCGGAASVH